MKPRACVPLETRLWRRVTKTRTCWLWNGWTNNGGYGMIGRGRKGEGLVLTHRAAYELLVGPIPKGMELDHLCRNTRCLRPSHLEPVTHHENMLRSATATKTHCNHGHRLAGENVRVTPQGHRRCRKCHNESEKSRRAILREAS